MEFENQEQEIELEREAFVGGKCNCYRTLTESDYNWNRETQTAEAPLNTIALWLLDNGKYLISPNTDITLTTESVLRTGIIDPTLEYPANIFMVEVIKDLKIGNVVIKMHDNMYNAVGITTAIVDSNGAIVCPIHNERYAFGGAPEGFRGNIGDIFISTVFNNEGRPSSMYILHEMQVDEETGDFIYIWKKVTVEDY